MSMPKYQIIVVFFLQHFFTVYDQPFLVFTQKNLFGKACLRPAAATQIICQSHANIRRKNSKQPLAKWISEDLLNEFIFMIAGAEAIAVGNVKLFSIPF